MVKTLTEMDYKVIEASNGEEGMELIKSERTYCVFCDIDTPHMDGIGFLEEINKKWNLYSNFYVVYN